MRKRFSLLAVLSLPAAALLGLGSVVGPPYIFGAVETWYPAPVFPWLRTGVENLLLLPTICGQFVCGFLFGFFCPRRWLLLGAGSVSFLPLAAITEMIVAPASHNLWPFEFMIYAILALPACFGSFVGKTVKWSRVKGSDQDKHKDVSPEY
jgi:hypothetical protein